MEEKKKAGRPSIGLQAMTAAQRQQARRQKQLAALMAPEGEGGKPSEFWTVQECLAALQMPKLKGTPLGKAAWVQLGKLHGYM